MKVILPMIAVSLLLTACGGGSSSDDASSNTTGTTGTQNASPENPSASTSTTNSVVVNTGFKCPATPATEASFSDTFISNNTANIDWVGPSSITPTTVDDIAAAFNTARSADPTINQTLKMPSQSDWDAMDSSQKGLYLVNSERCARGLELFEGIAPELITSSSSYATELSDNNEFSHNFGVYPDPTARLAGYANVQVGTNADFMAQSENLSVSSAGSTAGYRTLHEPVARAIYWYMYEDAEVGYGHRTFILIKMDNDNSGEAGSEGLFGLSAAQRQDADTPEAGFSSTTIRTVMHGFDPDENWDMNNVAAAPGIYGPEQASDCLFGTFTASEDESGNNTSTCN